MTDTQLPSTDVLFAVPQMMELAGKLKGAVGMIPEHLKTEGQILATILAGRELGLGPMAAMRGLHVVRGKVGADYSLWVAQLKRHGYSVAWLESGPERVVLQLTDPRGTKHTETWDKARAMQAGLWGKGEGWTKYPETMLRARAVTSAGRAFAAEVMSGGYSLDELDEIQSKPSEPTTEVRLSGTARLAARIEKQAAEVVKQAEVVNGPVNRDGEPIDPEDVPMQMSVEEIVAGMDQSQTIDDLNRWVDQAKGLNGTDKITAREAYSSRKAELLEMLAKDEDQ